MNPETQLRTALADRYAIEREIGRGGMATVYLARDLKHDRQVALKVLDPELAAVLGVERFLAEIRVTANLQHPNLLPLFDSGEATISDVAPSPSTSLGASSARGSGLSDRSGSFLFYVMPFVEGESLRAKLDREKQLPIDEALRIATAIAGALDYAHRRQVIHRDLKPENVLLHEGQPLVADFGIALAVSNAGGTRITQTGLSLGTPQYMSPEQATGDRAIDARSDIYSLAAVTYEMLTGEAPHTGNTSQAVIARILTEKPRSIRATRANVPEGVDTAIAKALEKLPADRFATAHAFADALQTGSTMAATTAGGASSPASPGVARAGNRRVLSAAALAAFAVGVGLTGLVVWPMIHRAAPGDTRVVRLSVPLPRGSAILWPFAGQTSSLAFSPDGKLLAFTALNAGRRQAYLYAVDRGEATPVPGTEDVNFVTFSPDGLWLAMTTAGGVLTKMLVSGGPTTEIAQTNDSRAQPVWVNDRTIVYTVSNELWRVSPDGGTPERFTNIVATLGKIGNLATAADPDGDLVYISSSVGSVSNSAIGVASVSTGKVTMLPMAGFIPMGYLDGFLVYLRTNGSLMAVRFDRRSLAVGTPVQIADSIDTQVNNAAMALSQGGDIAYVRATSNGQLVIVDEHGVAKAVSPEQRPFAHPRLSPDGSRLVFDQPGNGSGDIWEFNLGAATFTRVTTGGVNDRPEWMPGGKRVLYMRNIDQASGMFDVAAQVPGSSAPAELVFSDPRAIRELVVSRDGKTKVMRVDRFGGPAGSRDILIARDGNTVSTPLIATLADELMPRISPDGTLLAYISNESGRHEVYVQSLSAGSERIAVSNAGGSEPVWASLGKQLFYRHDQQMIEATIATSPSLAVGNRRVLFEGAFLSAPYHADYDVMPDGRHFIMIKPSGAERRLDVVLNWRVELEKLMRDKR